MSGRAAAAPFPRVVLFLRPVLRHVFLFYFPLMTSLLDRSLCCSPQREAAEKHTDWGGDDLKDSERTADCMRNKRHASLISLTLRHDTCL